MAIAAFPFFSHSFRVALWIERAVPQLVTCSKDCALPLRREQGGRPPSHSELSGFCAGTVPAFMSVPGKSCHAQLCKDRTPVLHSARLLAVEIRCLVSSLVILFPRCFILLCICLCEMCSSKHALLKRLFQVSRHPQALYSFKDVLGRMSAFLIYRDCSGHHSPFLPPPHQCMFCIPGSALALKVLCCISRPGRARVCFFLGKKGNNFAKRRPSWGKSCIFVRSTGQHRHPLAIAEAASHSAALPPGLEAAVMALLRAFTNQETLLAAAAPVAAGSSAFPRSNSESREFANRNLPSAA